MTKSEETVIEVYKNFEDINFAVLGKHKIDNYHMDFEAYMIEATGVDGENKGKVYYHKKGSQFYPDTVETLEEAEVYLHGIITVNGCSDWYFDEQDKAMLHGCRRKDLTALGEVMARCWDIAKEIIPNSHFK